MNFSYFISFWERIFVKALNVKIDPGNIFFQIILLIVIIIIVVNLIDFLLVRSVLGRNYRLFVAPGVVMHEFSHALFCLLTGAKISSISVFDSQGGSVVHEKPKVPILGQVLISLAPFAIGLICIYFFANWAGLKEIDLKAIPLKYDNVIQWIAGYFGNLRFDSLKNWLLIYLTLSVAVTMTPSVQDLKNIFLTLLFLTLAIFLVFKYFTFHINLSFIPAEKILTLLSTVFVLLILCLLFSIVLFAISLILKKKKF